MHKCLTDRGFKPHVQILDNKCPETLKKHFRKNNVAYQLVPPHLHRNNSAERAIVTFKDHLIAGLLSVDLSFPMHLWCRLISQARSTYSVPPASVQKYLPKLSSTAHLIIMIQRWRRLVPK